LQKRSTHKPAIKNRVKFHPALAALIIIMTGAIGTWVLKNSFAQSAPPPPAGFPTTLRVVIQGHYANSSTYHPISGIGVRLTMSKPQSCDNYSSDPGLTGVRGSDGAGLSTFNCLISPPLPAGSPPPAPGTTYEYSVYRPSIEVSGYSLDSAAPGGGINFSGTTFNVYVIMPPISVGLTASTPQPGSATVSWDSQLATACNASGSNSGSWSGPKAPPRGSTTISGLSGTVSFTLSCVAEGGYSANGAGFNSKTVSVNVAAVSSGSTGGGSGSSSSAATAKKAATPGAVGATVKATSGDTVAPTKPSNFTATQDTDGKKNNLSWSAATDNVGVTSYLIERSTDAATWKSISQSPGTSFSDSDLSSEATFYYYRLRAQDAVGNQSEAVFADVENTAVLGTEQATDKAAEPSQKVVKKQNSLPKVLEAVGGGILVLGALGGGAGWYRWRTSQYGEATVTITPSPTAQQAAPHTAKSLKEMVMENYHPPSQSGPPQAPPEPPAASPPPPPGMPPTQAG
jgi:hypothetical protein